MWLKRLWARLDAVFAFRAAVAWDETPQKSLLYRLPKKTDEES